MFAATADPVSPPDALHVSASDWMPRTAPPTMTPGEPRVTPAAFVVSEDGRISDPSIDANDRMFATCAHAGPLMLFFVLGPLALFAPFLVWAIGRNRGRFVDDHGRAAMDAMLSALLWTVIASVTVVGIPIALAIMITFIVNGVRASIAAQRGEFFRYPMALSITE